MRESDATTGSLFSSVDLALRVARRIANGVLEGMSAAFERAHSPIGRPSIPPERRF